jgi:protoporphyrinogen IX oxidase
MTYLLIKSLHLICIVSWFAGMFYIFRLFVYHVQNWDSLPMCQVFLTMERKLLTYIILPAASASFLSGISLLWLNPTLATQHWIWLKLCFVVVLLAYCALSFWVHLQFRKRLLVFSEKSCRLLNEIPTLALIAISLLVFIKPGLGQ